MNDPDRSVRPLGRLYLWATHRLYNEFAWAYDAVAWLVSAGHWDRWRRMALDEVRPGVILEVGFGTGELLIAMTQRGWRAVGLDRSLAMQRVTALKMQRRGVWAPRLCGLVERLPFVDDCFDTILSTFPAEYIVDPTSLAELYRALKPGGRLVVGGLVVFRERSTANRLGRALFGDPPVTSLERFEQRAAAAGFRSSLILRDDPPWRVPIVVAEKPA